MVLIPMKDTRKRDFAQFLHISFCTYGIKPQGLCRLIDAKH